MAVMKPNTKLFLQKRLRLRIPCQICDLSRERINTSETI